MAENILFFPKTLSVLPHAAELRPIGPDQFVIVAGGALVSVQPDGSVQTRSLNAIGPWEQCRRVGSNLVCFDGTGTSRYFFIDQPASAPVPAPVPVPTPVPVPNPPFTGDPRTWFMALVADKPFTQQTLLDLEPFLNANGWQLTPPNSVGDRTKVHPPNGPWTRVGFGEGHWVWMPQTQ